MFISRKRINDLLEAVRNETGHSTSSAMRALDGELFQLIDSATVVKVRHTTGDVIDGDLLSKRRLWFKHNNRTPAADYEELMAIRDLANWGGEGDEEGEPEIEYVQHLQVVPRYTTRLEDANRFKWAFFGIHLQLQLSENWSGDNTGIAVRADLVDGEQELRAVCNAPNWALATIGVTLSALLACENLVDEIFDFVD
ncbi:hypothetical protein [Devosia sp. 1566]|uniref:hypothetical protein n=1 Tax=Devosia sp. 1566 TaxID=2499144 RepID=UPI000FDB4B26|nr:hypothetical protein [Devosia sp. 1566]